MTFTLTLDKEQLEIMGAALGRLPYAQVAPLVQEINRQMALQLTKAQEPPAEPKVPEAA